MAKLRVHPADLLLVGIIWTAAVKGLASSFPAARQLGWLHVAFGVVLSAVVVYDAWRRQASFWSRIRPLATVAVVFTLYSTLGRLSVEAVGTDTWDPVLADIDETMLGFDPSHEIQRFLTPGRVELFALFYSWFIPYIHLSLFFNLESRGGADRERFLTSWMFLYAVSYLGYLFVPAFGPVMFPERHGHSALEGGYFLDLVRRSVDASGGLFGVFPSLHVGASVFLCRGDWSRDRLRSLMYLPIVLGIYVATIVLRYHYVIDLLAGTALALFSPVAGRWLFDRWERKR